MKTYKKKITKVIDEIICDCCGQSCTKQIDHEYATIEATWGYNSHQDGTQYNIEICEHCFNEVLAFMKKIRIRILGPYNYPYEYDPLNGKSYI